MARRLRVAPVVFLGGLERGAPNLMRRSALTTATAPALTASSRAKPDQQRTRTLEIVKDHLEPIRQRSVATRHGSSENPLRWSSRERRPRRTR